MIDEKNSENELIQAKATISMVSDSLRALTEGFIDSPDWNGWDGHPEVALFRLEKSKVYYESAFNLLADTLDRIYDDLDKI
jgi:hypothetical protein